jgi:hypothetical protein
MRKTTIILTAVCGLAAHISTAAAAPAWCKGGDEKPSYDLKSLFSETDADRALMQLVAASCYGEADVAQMGKQITATREAWNKKLGMVEADWADVSEWAHLPRHLRGDPKLQVTDRSAAWSAYTPIDQYGALSMADIGQVDPAYLADAFGTRLTQLGRLGYVAYCIGSHSIDPAVIWAACAPDAVALDASKIAAEVRADTTHGAGDRMTIRIVAYETFAALPKFQADIKALKAKDPAYATMFGFGDTARAEWSKTNPALIALVDTLDDSKITGSRKAVAGCTDKAWDAWKSAVQSIGAKRLGAIRSSAEVPFLSQVVDMLKIEPNGYLTMLALRECWTLSGTEDHLTSVIGYRIGRLYGLRGPRTATLNAIRMGTLAFDNRAIELEYPEIKRTGVSADASSSGYGLGGIASVKAEGDKVTITFSKVKVTQTRCTRGHYTNRLIQILPDGQLVYYYQCDAEVTETIMVEPWPKMTVHARYATGLKPGMTVEATDGVATAAFAKGSTIPSYVTGVEVK